MRHILVRKLSALKRTLVAPTWIVALMICVPVSGHANSLSLECLKSRLSNAVESKVVSSEKVNLAKKEIAAALAEGKPLTLDKLKTPAQKMALIELSNPERLAFGTASETLDTMGPWKRVQVTRALAKLRLSHINSPRGEVEQLKNIFLALHPPSDLPTPLRGWLQKGLSAQELVEAQVTSELSHRGLNQALTDLGIISKNGKTSTAIQDWTGKNLPRVNGLVKLGLDIGNLTQTLTAPARRLTAQNLDRIAGAAKIGLEAVSMTHGLPLKMPLHVVPEMSMLSRRIQALTTDDLLKICNEDFSLNPDKTAQALGIARSAKNTVWSDGVISTVNRGIWGYLAAKLGIHVYEDWDERKKALKEEQQDPGTRFSSDSKRTNTAVPAVGSESLDQLVNEGIHESLVVLLPGEQPADPSSPEAEQSLRNILRNKKDMMNDSSPVTETELNRAKEEYAQMVRTHAY